MEEKREEKENLWSPMNWLIACVCVSRFAVLPFSVCERRFVCVTVERLDLHTIDVCKYGLSGGETLLRESILRKERNEPSSSSLS